jgi:hypothetical protein
MLGRKSLPNLRAFHDLKRKGISDTTANERMASAGHRSPEMMKVYDVKPDVVKPTKT